MAVKLNVKTPSLYNHIKGLPALRKQLSHLSLIHIKEAMMEAVLGKAGDDALMAAGISYANFARHQPGLYDAIASLTDFWDPDLQHASPIIAPRPRVNDPFFQRRFAPKRTFFWPKLYHFCSDIGYNVPRRGACFPKADTRNLRILGLFWGWITKMFC